MRQTDQVPGSFNSHSDPRLTKSGGFDFDVWAYILVLEASRHGEPIGPIELNEWREFYDDDFTPHGAIEEDFNAGGD